MLAMVGAALIAPAAHAADARKPAVKSKSVPTAGPHAIGKFDDWIAVTNNEAGQPTCYAFTRATQSTPQIKGRGDVVLTVTERPGGRDAVAIAAGFAFAQNATMQVVADATTMEFYTSTRSAFAHDGHSAVVAFQKAKTLLAKSTAPKGGPVTDQFSLRGFSAAYAAVIKACPVPKPAA